MRMNGSLKAVLLALMVVTSTTPDNEVAAQVRDAGNRTRLKTETFDRDPGWEGRNNRLSPAKPPTINQNFGYSRTDHAGKQRGEIGGEFWQANRPAYYGKVIEKKGLELPLSASGSVAVTKAQSIMGWHQTSNVFIGWFSPDEKDLIWRPRNFIGFRLQSSNEPDGCLVEICYGTSAWQAGGLFVNAAGGGQHKNVVDLKTSDLLRIPPDGSKHQWSFNYDPNGANGAGEIVLVFNGNETRLALSAEHKKAGATLNRFGVFTPRIPGLDVVAYFDDLTIDGVLNDFSEDPNWEGFGNRRRYQDKIQYAYNSFGFSPTNHAGGKPGELGGLFFSCNPDENQFKAYYADRIGRLTFEDALTARGRFTAREHSTDSTFALGWFNSEKQDWPIHNFAGVYFDSFSSVGRIIEPMYGTSQGTNDRGGEHVTFVPGQSYEWTLKYDPSAADGRGAITFTIGDQSVTKPLGEGDKARGATFDRFGVFNMQWANSKWCDVYLDDMTYSVSNDR